MSIVNKIKEKGIAGCAVAVKRRIIKIANKALVFVYACSPVEKNKIVLESEGDCCDNAYAIFDYMRKNGYVGKYKIIWLVDEPKNFKNSEDVIYVHKQINDTFSPETIKALRTCHWYIYDHCNIMAQFKKRKGQVLIYLSHGWGYKASKGGSLDKCKSVFDFMIATGPLSAEGQSQYWNTPLKKTVIAGYPRLDYLFTKDCKVQECINKKWHFDQYTKIFFWMPTFRQSKNRDLSEEYNKNETGLPLFESVNSLRDFNEFLKQKNAFMVFKLHHLQLELPVFKLKFSNIVVIRDEELQQMGIQLYQLIQNADVLISDYSSISIDYLVIDRPIIYTLDDYEEYDKSRGLFPSNAVDYMPGYHVYNIDELKTSMEEILNGIDKYSEQRSKIVDKYHKYKDGNSAKRILDKFGILK